MIGGEYCLVELRATGGGGGACGTSAPRDDPHRPHAMDSTTRDGYRVSGAVVDGVSDLRLHLRAGASVPIDVQANLFAVDVESRLQALTFTRPDGSRGRISLNGL